MNMNKLVIVLIAVLTSVSVPCLAKYKEVGGGNGFGGTLLDRAEYDSSTQISSEDTYHLLVRVYAPLFSHFPFLRVEASDLFLQRKNVYLEDRPLNTDCLDQSTLDIRNSKILACQNDVEIRIDRSWWMNANENEQADLLLHEQLTDEALSKGQLDAVRYLFNELTSPSVADVEKKNAFFKFHFRRLLDQTQSDCIYQSLESILLKFEHAQSLVNADQIVTAELTRLSSENRAEEALVVFQAAQLIMKENLLPLAHGFYSPMSPRQFLGLYVNRAYLSDN